MNFRFEDIGKDEGSKNWDYILVVCEFVVLNIGKVVRIVLEIFDCLDEFLMVCWFNLVFKFFNLGFLLLLLLLWWINICFNILVYVKMLKCKKWD